MVDYLAVETTQQRKAGKKARVKKLLQQMKHNGPLANVEPVIDYLAGE